MKRIIFFAYGVACHLMFLGTYAWLAGFVANVLVPKTIDAPAADGSLGMAIAVDLLLLFVFVLQHSVMARPAFKRLWTKIVPTPIERSTYVLISCLVTGLLIWQWRPIPVVIWHVSNLFGWWLAVGMLAAGWLAVPAVSLMINHFDLFGTRQVWLYLQGKEYEPLPFRTPLAYAWVRHPLYVGWTLAFWMTPTMTAGHLLFAIVLTGYMALAALVEERDLMAFYGQTYHEYRRRVPMFIPGIARRRAPRTELRQLPETL
jgi:methanethiol S-methyltransferase